jgi:hypothetical protein
MSLSAIPNKDSVAYDTIKLAVILHAEIGWFSKNYGLRWDSLKDNLYFRDS